MVKERASSSSRGAGPDPARMPLSVSVYQNPDYVVGILQQMVQRGLLTVEEIERTHDAASAETSSKSARAETDAGANVGPLGRLSIAFGAEAVRGRDASTSSGDVLRQRIEYSQAYYLYLVRRLLDSDDRILRLNGLGDARDVEIGSFVEYQAQFAADEAGAIPDIAFRVLPRPGSNCPDRADQRFRPSTSLRRPGQLCAVTAHRRPRADEPAASISATAKAGADA